MIRRGAWAWQERFEDEVSQNPEVADIYVFSRVKRKATAGRARGSFLVSATSGQQDVPYWNCGSCCP